MKRTYSLLIEGDESGYSAHVPDLPGCIAAGATKEEIAEALGVAVAMNAGAALIYSTRVLDAVAAKTAQGHSA